MNINQIDIYVIVIYLIAILFIGVSVGYKKNISKNDYFLAGRSLNWLVVGSALFATNISTIHLVGLASDGYRLGLVVGNFEFMAVFSIILLGLIFAPFYFKSKITTLPEYLEKRYSTNSRTFLAFVAVISALLIHIGIGLYAGAQVMNDFFGIPILVSITLISVITAIYTVLGGLKAVVVTETIQTVILLLGAISLTLAAFFALPSVGIESWADLQQAVKPNQTNMLWDLRDENGKLYEYSWYSIVI